jgi:hypothetical protein
MSVLSKPTAALHRKRLASALIAMSLCALLGACSNDDDKTPDASSVSYTDNASDNGNTAQVLPATPSYTSPASPALTIQTPARPASSADPALSAAASTPLATPVIHTVD